MNKIVSDYEFALSHGINNDNLYEKLADIYYFENHNSLKALYYYNKIKNPYSDLIK